jgi:hypothetical protein
MAGTIARISDDTTASGTCAQTAGALTGGSNFSSVCICRLSTDWEEL